jgi:hypothetical protein
MNAGKFDNLYLGSILMAIEIAFLKSHILLSLVKSKFNNTLILLNLHACLVLNPGLTLTNSGSTSVIV